MWRLYERTVRPLNAMLQFGFEQKWSIDGTVHYGAQEVISYHVKQ